MALLKKQSFLSLLLVTVTLAGVILAIWWIFTSPAEAPEQDAEFQQIESEFENQDFGEEDFDKEFSELEEDINNLETELQGM
ncbi:MAG: hypothetical protein WD712_00365 [Candidatus Spechtbacterales bacterium]